MSADLDKLDRAIDRAVRDMLDVEPPSGLRARVIARLPASGSRLPAFGFRLPAAGWVLGSIAAVTLVVLAVWVARRSPVVPQAAIVARAGDQRLAAPATPAVPSVARVEPGRIKTTATRSSFAAVASASPRSRFAVAANIANETDTTSIAPLTTIAPIAVASIEPQRIVPADTVVPRLTPITELQISPMTPPTRR